MILTLLDAVSRAPSRFNEQPVRVRREADGVTLLLAGEPTADAGMALGAALENARAALAGHGQEGGYETLPGPSVRLRWRPGAVDPSLYRLIPLRRTSRLPYALTPLAEVPHVEGVRLVEDPETLRRAVARELDGGWRHWLRASPRDPRWHRDGLTADCLGMRRWEAWLLARLPWAWLAGGVDDLVPPCPAMGEVVPSGDPVEDGRRLQRYWLLAAGLGLSLHPLWAGGQVVFRLGVSPPVPRSPRRPLDELLV